MAGAEVYSLRNAATLPCLVTIMRSRRFFLVLTVLATALSSPLSAQLPDQLFGDPAAAAEFDYCGWAHKDGGALPAAPDLGGILESGGLGYDGLEVAAAVLVGAGTALALGAPDARACRKIFKDGDRLFKKRLRADSRRFKGSSGWEKSADSEIAAVQRRLSEFWAADQSARMSYVALRTESKDGPAFWAARRSVAHTRQVDSEATAYMKSLLERYDWIDRDRFGRKISKHAWLLVQHADADPDFQMQALERMEPYLQTGGVKPANYAYLWDRVAVNSGRKQRYGTQPVWDCRDGGLELAPIEDLKAADALRAEFGMPSVEQDLQRMSQASCGPAED